VTPREFAFDAELWRWQSTSAPAAWHFLTLPVEMAVEIRLRTMGRRKGFGSVRVEAAIGGSVWRTSIFPAANLDSYLLPVKASVRKAEHIAAGDPVAATLSILDA
jgi:Domain of unknown function (DUF1905)